MGRATSAAARAPSVRWPVGVSSGISGSQRNGCCSRTPNTIRLCVPGSAADGTTFAVAPLARTASPRACVAWQFSATDPETREKAALRFIAISFFALAAYVAVDAVLSLLGLGEVQPSKIGIVLASASLVVMPVLSLAQSRAGRELGSLSAVADSKQTLLCTYLSAILLVGLVLNGLWGWSWADPAAALGIAAIAVREGANAWRGDPCC